MDTAQDPLRDEERLQPHGLHVKQKLIQLLGNGCVITMSCIVSDDLLSPELLGPQHGVGAQLGLLYVAAYGGGAELNGLTPEK